MPAVAFDTLKYSETLREAGVPETQAKVQAEALASVLQQREEGLVTKTDVAELGRRLDVLATKVDMLLWMLGGGLLLLLIRTFWPLSH